MHPACMHIDFFGRFHLRGERRSTNELELQYFLAFAQRNILKNLDIRWESVAIITAMYLSDFHILRSQYEQNIRC